MCLGPGLMDLEINNNWKKIYSFFLFGPEYRTSNILVTNLNVFQGFSMAFQQVSGIIYTWSYPVKTVYVHGQFILSFPKCYLYKVLCVVFTFC